MKFVTNTVPVITNGIFPMIQHNTNKVDWSKVELTSEGTIFKVKAVVQNVVFLENSNGVVGVDCSIFNKFFVEHEMEV